MKVTTAATLATTTSAPSREQKAFDEMRAGNATRRFAVSFAPKPEQFMKVAMGIRSASIDAASPNGAAVSGDFEAKGAQAWFKSAQGGPSSSASYVGAFTGTQDAVDAAYAQFSNAVSKLLAASGS